MSRKFWVILALIIAGEAIFSLPFHVPRFFRATMLDVFALTNANLGDVFAVYGVTAMLAYFPGGTIADRYSPRRLMAFSLFATALGGIYLATVPGIIGLSVLFGYWGITSILLLWAALIRSTREWGGELSQGRAFGILDGGRGLFAAGLASIAVMLFRAFYLGEPDVVDPELQRLALTRVIYFYTVITMIAALVVWWLVPDSVVQPKASERQLTQKIITVLRDDTVWLQAAIVVCAYCGYKGLDNYALYAVQVLNMSEADAAGFTATNAYLRPVAAVLAGVIADRFSASRVMLLLFVLLSASFGYLGIAEPSGEHHLLISANILLTFAGVYALRGVYFALLEETQVPPANTGTAVGLISLVGFTPDIFFAAIGGRLLDRTPGIGGHHDYFVFLALLMVAGAITVLALIQRARRRIANI